MRSLVLLCVASTALAAKKVAPEIPKNELIDYLTSLGSDVITAAMGAAMDVLGLVIACPRFLVDMFVLFLEYARWTPTLGKSIVNGDAATLKMMTDFCVYASSIIFVVYAALTALNLSLQLAVGVKDYFASWMVLPTKPLGFTLPKALMDVRNWIQEHMINPIIRLKCGSWIVPLEGQSGAPSLKAATSVLASACSACMILACAPAVHDLMASGADKAKAEALAYTVGTALGMQYLVKIAA